MAVLVGGSSAERDSTPGRFLEPGTARELEPAVESETLLALRIGKDGRVRGIHRLAGSMDTGLLERAVRWASRQRYHPALDDRIPVEGVVTIRIR
jgi:hypothetical protein